MRVPPFLKCENRFCGKTVLVPLDTPTIEIDTMADWSLAEVYAKNLEVRSGIPSNVGHIKALVTDFDRSEEHTSELQSLMRISYAGFCLKKKNTISNNHTQTTSHYKNQNQI